MRMRWIVGIGALTAALAACSAGGSVNVGGASSSASGSGSGSAGTLTVAISGEPDQLDPQKTSDYNSFEVLENVFDTLVEPNANLQMEPALATSWTTSKNQLTWSFTLRSTTWQDGTPFTSADVVYSYDRIIDQKLPNSYRFAAVKSVTADGARKVILTLKQPTPDLLNDIGGFMGVAIVEKKNVASSQIAQDPVGTGPYRVVSWDHGLSITLAANPHYWGGAPKIQDDQVRIRLQPDRRAAGPGGRRGAVDRQPAAAAGAVAAEVGQRLHGEVDPEHRLLVHDAERGA